MSSLRSDFRTRYGPWALVAGASEGIGAEFARQIAAQGINIAAVARRVELLDRLEGELTSRFGVEVRTLSTDLAAHDAAAIVRETTQDLEIGLMVYNAALSPIGPFLEHGIDDALRALDLNCRTPLALAHAFGRDMAARGRGGLLLMSSMSGLQGSPLIATYAATKAFDLVLGEGLWDELRGSGVDALAFCAGATRTPNYEASAPRRLSRFAPSVMEPGPVATEALGCLGTVPSAIAGRSNRISSWFMQRMLSRRRAIEIMGRATRAMYAGRQT